MKFLDYLSSIIGFKNTTDFADSTFGTLQNKEILVASLAASTVGIWSKSLFGFELPVILGVLALFAIELSTGIGCAFRRGEDFSTKIFMKGWIKFFIYVVLVAVTNIFYTYIDPKPIFGFELNIYEWIYFTFSNWVIIHMFISVMENFIELGWDKHMPLITHLGKLLKLKNVSKKSEEPNQ